MKLRWTFRARQDLLEIGRFIATDNRQAARKFINRLQAKARKVAKFPRSGRRIPEFNRQDLREVLEGNYRIVYKVTKKTVDVLTVFEGHRQLPEKTIS